MWKAKSYETIGNPESGFMVGGWMIRRGDNGNTRERADSIFVPMKWTPEPPKAIADLVDALNGSAERAQQPADFEVRLVAACRAFYGDSWGFVEGEAMRFALEAFVAAATKVAA